ncbi:MAG: hypothetical protein QM831_27875 [Kofleriaceae bacterium]
MTYRDDTDAALARADALQTELERSEKERARLAAELEALRNPKPTAALVVGEATALTTTEIETLVIDVAHGFERTKRADTKIRVAIAGSILLFAFAIGVAQLAAGVVFGIVGVLGVVASGGHFAEDNIDFVMKHLVERPQDVTALTIARDAVYISVGKRTARCTTYRGGTIGKRLHAYCTQATVK